MCTSSPRRSPHPMESVGQERERERERERDGRDIAIGDFVQFDLTYTHAVIYFYLRMKTDYLEVKQRNDSGRVARQNM